MHVIGFDVTEAEREQLQCIAEAGGGTYFTADTAQQFSIAAQAIVDKSKYQGSYLKIVAIKNDKPFNAAADVLPAGEEEYLAHGLTPQEFKLLPGIYDVRVKDRGVPSEPTVWIRGIKLEAGERTERIAEFTDGRLEVAALKNGKAFNATVDIFPAGEQEYIAYGLTPQEFKLIPGTYDIRVKDRNLPGEPEVWIRGVEVEPGQKIRQTAEFVDGQLMVIALMDGQSVRVEVDIFPAGEEHYIAYGHTPRGFRLLPGVYDVRVKDRSVPQEPVAWVRGVEVTAGGKVKVEAEF
jgi:Ca-activated chloride channel family protein